MGTGRLTPGHGIDREAGNVMLDRRLRGASPPDEKPRFEASLETAPGAGASEAAEDFDKACRQVVKRGIIPAASPKESRKKSLPNGLYLGIRPVHLTPRGPVDWTVGKTYAPWLSP
jgi:hypothetical protein